MAEIRELELGVWLDESVADNVRSDIEALCSLMASCVADAVITLRLFEEARASCAINVVQSEEERQRDREREERRESELTDEQGLTWAQPDYDERIGPIREQARRDALRQKWAEEDGPETYRWRLPFIHAQSFVAALALLQRSLIAMSNYNLDPQTLDKILRACEEFASALPGLRGVRDSAVHAEDRARGRVREKTLTPGPVKNELIHAPKGALVLSSIQGCKFGGTIADGPFAEIEVSDETTEVARVAVQAVYDALPWKPGFRHFEPSH